MTMSIFHNARLKLTAWYLVIIMIVSLSFSFFVYRNVIGEITRGFRIRSLRTSFITNEYLEDDQRLYEDVRNRIILQLAIVNGVVFVLSATAGYILSDKTLKPIELMVEEQKRFIGDASHELRTPLTSLKTEIEVNLRDKNATKQLLKETLVSNLEEVNKMQSLTNYLLSLTKYEGGDKKLTKEKINVKDLTDRIYEKYKANASLKSITLKKITKVKEINANATSLEELISILVDNAIKYSNTKGKVVLKIIARKGHVEISVTDSGIGIKQSDIPYIFNRFYRADMSRAKAKVDGYGLGLSIAKSIVEAYKGKIDVLSTPGKGSTFRVIIPQ